MWSGVRACTLSALPILIKGSLQLVHQGELQREEWRGGGEEGPSLPQLTLRVLSVLWGQFPGRDHLCEGRRLADEREGEPLWPQLCSPESSS